MDFCDVSIKLPLQLIQHVAKYPQDWDTVAAAQVTHDHGAVIETDFTHDDSTLHCQLKGKCSDMFSIMDDHFKFKLTFSASCDLDTFTNKLLDRDVESNTDRNDQPYVKGSNSRYVIGEDGLCYIEYELTESEEESSNGSEESFQQVSQNRNHPQYEERLVHKKPISQLAKQSTTNQIKANLCKKKKVRSDSSGSGSGESSTLGDCSSGDEWLPQSEAKAKQLKSYAPKTKENSANYPAVKVKNIPKKYQIAIKKEVSSAQSCVQRLKTKAIINQQQKANKKKTNLMYKEKQRPKLQKLKKNIQKLKEKGSLRGSGFTCDHCRVVVQSEQLLKEHKERICRVLHPNRPRRQSMRYACHRCGFSTLYQSQIDEHKQTCAAKTVCDECGQVFVYRSCYFQHRRQVHGKGKPLQWKTCPYCERKFHHTSHFNRHVNQHPEHEIPFVCEVCGKGFRQKARLNQHMSIHTGVYRRHCEKCGHGMHRAKDVRKHKCGRTRRKPNVNMLLAQKNDTKAATKATVEDVMGHSRLGQNSAQFSAPELVSISSGTGHRVQPEPSGPVAPIQNPSLVDNYLMTTTQQMHTSQQTLFTPNPFYPGHYSNQYGHF